MCSRWDGAVWASPWAAEQRLGAQPRPRVGQSELCPTALDERQRKSLVTPRTPMPPQPCHPLGSCAPKPWGYFEPPSLAGPRLIQLIQHHRCAGQGCSGLGQDPGPQQGPHSPSPQLSPVQDACAWRVRLPTAGGKELSQRIATNSWRSGLLCSRHGPAGGKLPWKEAD